MKMILVLSGPVASGKTRFAEALAKIGNVQKVSTRNYIINKTNAPNERAALQAAGTRLDEETGGMWVVDAIDDAAQVLPAEGILLLDSAKINEQVAGIRRKFGVPIFHIHLTASDDVLSSRYLARKADVEELATYEEVRKSATEAGVGALAGIADIVLQTDVSSPDNLASVALAACGATPLRKYRQLVDVFVGGQYGSEGKGNVCSYLAKDYDVLMRVGGPNAGHMAADPLYKYVQLPSGTGANPKAKILIAAGSTLWLPQLMLEIRDHGLSGDRLSIDPQAMVIDDSDRRAESDALESIASTKQGVGAASARKILGRGSKSLFGPPVQLARDVKQLKSFVRDTKVELDAAFSAGKYVMLEGTQGTSLSLHHGEYPYVTSRETSGAGCLSDAGIAPCMVRKVIMVTRTYPIRVGGTSGPMAAEITLEEVAKRSGISIAEMLRVEKGTISGNQRRMAEFDWMQIRRSALLNGATDIALTFADYHGITNRGAKTFDDLLPQTKEFILRLERVTGASVSLISKEFAKDGVIDRRQW